MSISFYVLLINIWAGVLVISIILSHLAKCLFFRFQFICTEGLQGHEGRYMAFLL
jgi:hypothetical protein